MNDPEDSVKTTEVAFGQVVNIRIVPTRDVTQIVIEVPAEYHVALTTMLFGKNAMLFAASPKVQKPYGIYPLDKIDEPSDNEEKQSISFKEGGLTHSINITKWLGIQCQTVRFIQWIGAEDSNAAIAKVRELCGVTSRSEIQNNRSARLNFMNKIYHPYNQYSL